MLTKKEKTTRKNGFTLLEVLFAIGLILMSVVAAFGLIQRNVSAVSFLEHQSIALGLAQEGIEAVFAIRNSNYIDKTILGGGSSTTFGSNGLNEAACGPGTPKGGCEIECVNPGEYFPDCMDVVGGFSPIRLADTYTNTLLFFEIDGGRYFVGAGPAPTLFSRKIIIAEVPAGTPDYLDVLVQVFWNEKGNTQKVELETRVYNWLPI